MKATKKYNPNNFNALHSGIAYLLYLAAFTGVGLLFGKVILPEMARAENFDYSLYLSLELLTVSAVLLAITAIMSFSVGVHPFNGGGFLARKGCGVEMLMAAVLMAGVATLFSPTATTINGSLQSLRSAMGIDISTNPDYQYVNMSWEWLYLFVLMPILPAIFEELLFRGVIMRGFLQWGKVPAVLLSSLLFAFAHGSANRFFLQFIGGCVFGFLAVETKNIAVSMAAHFSYNFFISVSAVFKSMVSTGAGGFSIMYYSIFEIGYIAIGTVCFAAGILYFGKRLLHNQKNPERACGNVKATFIGEDAVLGTVSEEKHWYECGKLSEREAEGKQFLSSYTGKRRLNKKSGFISSAVLSAIGIIWALAMWIVSFLA